MSVAFHERLSALGLAHTWQDNGPGTHAWPYWQRDLRAALPGIMDAFARPPARPRLFSYRSGDREYAVYGWRGTMGRSAGEFSELDDAGHSGFTLRASGAASVVTGPLFLPGRRYAVTTPAGRVVTRPDGTGRLHLDVPLGPSNGVQRYTLAARLAGTRTFSAVRIRRLPRRKP